MYEDILRVIQTHSTLGGKVAGMILNPCLWAVACYRLAHWLWKSDVVLLPRLLSLAGRMTSGVDIAPSAEIGPGMLIVHGVGVTIEPGVRIGKAVTLYQGVGMGKRFGVRNSDGVPMLGDDVEVYAGAMILGPITIGDRCRIGANAVVTRSFLDDTTIAGVPAHAVGRCRPGTGGTAGIPAVVDTARERKQLAHAGAYPCSATENQLELP